MLVKSEAHTPFTKSLKSDEEVLPAHYALYWWRRKAANQTFREPVLEVLTLAREDLNECPVDADLEPKPSRWVTGKKTGVTGKLRPAFLTAGAAIPLHGTVITFMVGLWRARRLAQSRKSSRSSAAFSFARSWVLTNQTRISFIFASSCFNEV